MIVGNLRQAAKDGSGLHPVLDEAIRVLETTDFSNLSLGKHELKGNRMFMNIQEYDTKDVSEMMYEKHAAHIDVQYVISGDETIHWAASDDGRLPDDDRLESDDFALYQGLQPTGSVHMTEGTYLILFPGELHQPCVSPNPGRPVRKVVIKIRAELLD